VVVLNDPQSASMSVLLERAGASSLALPPGPGPRERVLSARVELPQASPHRRPRLQQRVVGACVRVPDEAIGVVIGGFGRALEGRLRYLGTITSTA
jgi:hypothetical protein